MNALWHSQLRLSQGTDNSHTYGVYPGIIKTQNDQVAWQNNLKIADTQNLTFSAEHLKQTVASDIVYTQTGRNVNSVLGGYSGEFSAQQLQINVRQDSYSDFGTANTGLLGYGVAFADSWRLKASISNAFRAPTLNDMFAPFEDYGFYGTYVGNPNLKPERSQNKEAGLHYAANGQHLDFVYFDNRIRDLIASNNLFAGSEININQAHITGQSLSYAGDFGNKHLSACMTFQNPVDEATGAVLPRRAKQFGNIAASHDLNEWNLGAEVRYSGVRQDMNYNTYASAALPAYQLLNLTAKYQISKTLNLSARLDNLFNRDYSEVYGYNTLGRRLFVALTYRQ